MQTHYLKCLPVYYARVENGDKPFEIRKNDRDFQTGDTLVLQQWEPEKGYSGQQLEKDITYVLTDVPHLGLQAGYAILGLRDLRNVFQPDDLVKMTSGR